MSTNTFHPAPGTSHRIPAGRPPQDARPAPAAPATMRLTCTVPKEFVHRAALAEVLLTGHTRLADNRFQVTAQWPRSHSFYTPLNGTHHDPLLAAETIRQVGAFLPHAEFGVPIGHQFLMRTFDLQVDPAHLHVGATPADLDIDVTFHDIRTRGTTHTAARYDAVVRRHGDTVATGSFTYTCITPQAYRRLRGNHGHLHTPLTAPLPPQSVGRLSPTDVVLSPTTTPNTWQLRIDTRHPVLFDHPVDHAPGMLLAEAARQAAIAATPHTTPLIPTHIHSTYHHYVELDTPCHIHAQPLTPTPHGHHTKITGTQNGKEMFHTTLTTTPL
ncbi:ScbA/BarX family gamma-butyrolactone biosynthesis protein [Streptomyces sp. NPDC005385]|uniref:ScbA/BarX family gamma-butyrolactone biosynthesis protein n=1 Tax=Streptomyces sp. NPDC005385 TaxID=3157039 RepID=UPI00339FE3DB